ncbi:porin [Massilia sp. TN1-12]|uniref:porin n=1 Tax=Massilia paldalensis TaxID=3377675 RepID=UPI00384D4CBC
MKAARAFAGMASMLVIGGSACAQTAPQLYGVLDLWGGRSETSAGDRASTMVNNGGMQTSFWGWSGSEPLGGGTRAIYTVEGYLQLDTGASGRTPTDAMFARNAFVGLQGPLGELKMGRILNPLFVATAQSNPFGGSIRLAPLLAQIWSPQQGRAVSGDTSWDNVVSYTTPAMAGAKLAVLAGLGETAFGTSAHNLNATLSWVSGPAVLYATAQRVRVGPGLAAVGRSEQSTYFVGGSYDLGRIKLFGSYDLADSDAPDLEARTGQAGVAIRAGGGSIMASWARTTIDAAGAAPARRDTGAIGYDYALSRRTDAYAVAQVDRLSGANRAKTYALGIRHRF